MNENPYRSPNAAEAERSKVRFTWKNRFDAAFFGLGVGLCCFLPTCGAFIGILNVIGEPEAVRQSPSIGILIFLGVTLTPIFIGTIAGAFWFLRADDRQRKTGSVILGVCIFGIVVIAFLLNWFFVL